MIGEDLLGRRDQVSEALGISELADFHSLLVYLVVHASQCVLYTPGISSHSPNPS